MDEDQGRRCKIIPISSALFCDLLVKSERSMHVRCVEGLPTDAQLRGHGYDVLRDMHYLVFWSAEWELVPFGQELPIFIPCIQRLYSDDILDQAAGLIGDHLPFDDDARQWLEQYRSIREV